MSNIKIKTDYYIKEENDELADYQTDQSIIIQKKHLKSVKNLNYNENSTQPTTNDIDWYPLVNSYYKFTEDVDPCSRIHHLIENQSNNLNSYHNDLTIKKNYYSEFDTQLNYLKSKPISFLILGKPNIGQEELGKQLADYWKCIYIDPETVIKNEIESNSRTGYCIEFNLRCGRAIDINIILRLVEKRIRDDDVAHRGFVLAGLPLIRNDLFEEDPVSSESAIFNVAEIFDDLIETVFNSPDLSPMESCKDVSVRSSKSVNGDLGDEDLSFGEMNLDQDYKAKIIKDFNNYHEQIDFIFGNLLNDLPLMIVYISCDSEEVLEKRWNYRFNILSKQFINPDWFYLGDLSKFDYLVKLPENFPSNVRTQLKQYYDCLINNLEHYIMLHNQEYYIKIDGRLSIIEILNIIKERLKILPIQPVLLAQPFNLLNNLIINESPKIDDSNDNLTFEELFEKLSKQQIINELFKWQLSNWGYKCPVSLKNGIIRNGNKNFPIHFMNKIFFLFDEESCEKFCINPRKFLLPPLPKIKNRIIIFGPSNSGCTTLANCLKYLYNCTILTPKLIEEKYFKIKLENYKELMKQKAQIEGMNLLNEKRLKEFELLNQEFNEKINEWKNNCLEKLDQLNSIYNNTKQSSLDFTKISSFRLEIVPLASNKKLLGVELQLRNDLIQLNLPEIKTSADCLYYSNLNNLMNCLPDYLINKNRLVPATIFDDFVIDYVNKIVEEIVNIDTNSSETDIYEMYSNAIEEIENDSNRNGWIIDGMKRQTNLIQWLLKNYLPNEIIFLNDNSENNEFLLKNFRNSFEIDLRDFFRKIPNTPTDTKIPSIDPKLIIDDILNNIIDNLFPENHNETIENYRKHLIEFNNEFQLIKNFLPNDRLITINIDGRNLEQILEESINRIEDRYREIATIFDENDRSEEVRNFRNCILTQTDTETDLNTNKNYENELFYATRRYGDTLDYCPVTFHDNWVLWKGKEEFSVKFLNKIYLLSTRNDMELFLKNPRKYLRIIEPPKQFPPLRICVIGCDSCGKTTISKLLSKNLGICYINYDEFSEINCFESGELFGDSIKPVSIKRLWFEEPIKSFGFVLDNFPKNSQHFQLMIAMKTIPDIIINVSVMQQIIIERLLPKKLQLWERELKEKLSLKELEKRRILIDWEEKKMQRFEELMEIKREERFLKQLNNNFDTKNSIESINDIKSSSQVSFNSVAELEDFEEVNKIIENEFPLPEFEEIQLENFDEATECIQGLLIENFSKQIQLIEELQELAHRELIKFVEINGNLELNQTIAQAFIVTNKLRNNSLFERCLKISIDTAEHLLIDGYYFLSQFGRICPVQYYENQIPQYLSAELNLNLFPIIHRNYIYFIVGKENCDKFELDPLKYVTVTKRINLSLLQFRLAVIGPPKSGKTVLAQRFQNYFGFQMVSRGKAIRYVLNNLRKTVLFRKIERELRNGLLLDEELVMKCVQILSSQSQGLVYDGFPQTINEMKLLLKFGLLPHLIIDLETTQIYSNLKSFSDFRTDFPIYSQRFLANIYKNYKINSRNLRYYCKNELQLIERIKTKSSLWGIWLKALNLFNKIVLEIKEYYTKSQLGVVLPLNSVPINRNELFERLSSFQLYCPYCLCYLNILRNAGNPIKRNGLLQYRKYFFWFCDEHYDNFLKKPNDNLILLNNNENVLPKNLPEFYESNEFLLNNTNLLYENGLCIVCYLNNLPKRLLINGNLNFSIKYSNKVYLFDCNECMLKFMEQPRKYYKIEINFKKFSTYPQLNDLPSLGLLEQYVAENLIKSLNHININRPIIPGLTIENSALISVGLHLKLFNKKTDKRYLNFYKEAERLLIAKRNCLINYLGQMKKLINPYLLCYEEPKLLCYLDDTSLNDSSNTQSMNSIFDELLNRIDYDKPSMLTFINDVLNRINYDDYSNG